MRSFLKKFAKFFLITIVALIILLVVYFIDGTIRNLIYDNNRIKNLELDNSTIIVMEEEYTNYLEELYLNPKKYIGKEIVIEGFYENILTETQSHNFVGRKMKTDLQEEKEHQHTEDCEHEELVGIEFDYDGEIPKIGSFIRVTGKLSLIEIEEYYGMEYPVLIDCKIDTEIPIGKEYVE